MLYSVFIDKGTKKEVKAKIYAKFLRTATRDEVETDLMVHATIEEVKGMAGGKISGIKS